MDVALPVAGAKRLKKRLRGMPILYTAFLFDFWQLCFGLIYIPLLGVTAAAEASASLLEKIALSSSVLSFITAFFLKEGSEAVSDLGVSTSVLVWLMTVIIAIVGYFMCWFMLTLRGIKSVSGSRQGAKLTLLILGFTADVAFLVNGLLFGLTIWVFYALKHPE